MIAEVVKLPPTCFVDVPNALRELAKGIEAGEYGEAHNLAWVVDCGEGRIEVGLCGKAPETGVTAYFLLALGQRRIEGGCIVP